MRILALLASCTFLYFIADSYLSQLNRQLCHAVIADDHRAGVHQRLEHHRTADDEQITGELQSVIREPRDIMLFAEVLRDTSLDLAVGAFQGKERLRTNVVIM